MVKVGSRTYNVPRAEFPLEIRISVDGLSVNRAVVGHFRMIKELEVVKIVKPVVKTDPTGMILTCGVTLPKPPQPHEPPPFDITCNIQGFFDEGVGEDTSYLISIKNQLNQELQTELFLPTVNPASATLRFLVR